MKLVELRITNFKGLGGDKNSIKFSDSNIIFLIGQNNVGKSSFLDAYEYFVNPKQKADLTDFFQYEEANTICFEGDFEIEESDKTDKELSKEPDWVSKWVQKSNGLITIKKECSRSSTEFHKSTKDADGNWVLNGFGGFDTIFKKYAPEPIKINAIETIESLEKKINEIMEKEFIKKLNSNHKAEYDDAIASLKKLQNLITSTEAVSSYNENINKGFKQVFPQMELKISVKDPDNIELEKALKSNHSVDVVKSGIERKELFSQHGHGVIRQALFNFIAFLKTAGGGNKKQYLILFEEPELFLHPNSERMLRDQLYELAENSPFQIFCATHSAQMIDISRPHSSLVRIVKHDDETTSTYQVGHTLFQSDEFKDFIQMVNRYNPHICETFYASNVLIVEGDTEAIICREYFKEHYPNNDIFILNSGSKNNIPFFQEILNHFSIDYGILHDSDTRYVYEDLERSSVKKNKDGSPKNNSAWTINSNISDKLKTAKANKANRWISVYDFESANKYQYDANLGKPMSAYIFYKNNKGKNLPVFEALNNFVDGIGFVSQDGIEKLEEPVTST